MQAQKHSPSGLSFLKYNLAVFMWVFSIYFVLLATSYFVTLLCQANGGLSFLIAYVLGKHSLVTSFAVFLVSLLYRTLFIYSVYLLSSFVFNVYYFFMFAIRVRAQNPGKLAAFDLPERPSDTKEAEEGTS